MTSSELYYIKREFEIKIYKLCGNAFEDFFVEVMTYLDSNFEPVKPQGSYGDRKNDGFNKITGEYYQVYSPEEIRDRTKETTSKLIEDFKGLKKHWDKVAKITKYNFVVNDKFKGVGPEVNKTIIEMGKDYQDIEFNIILAKDFQRKFLNLKKDIITLILGPIPNPESLLRQIKISELSETIKYLLNKTESINFEEEMVPPDFYDKIKFNKLGEKVRNLLITANYQVGVLNEYFDLDQNFTKQRLQKVFRKLYLNSKEAISNSEKDFEDKRFFYILKEACTTKSILEQNAMLIVMSYYFEYCDIFETPVKNVNAK